MLKDTLKKMLHEFNLNEELGVGKAIEDDVVNKLDKSVKLDEVDTVTFGLETDDGKIVKVYVKAEQAEAFEKALSEKLGEVDDIEEALNDLAKDFEIVDVEWPDEERDEPDNDEDDLETDGSESLNKQVYDNPKEKRATKHEIAGVEEGLNVGETFALQLMEGGDGSSVEARLNTTAQHMVYNAILELGIPAVALNRSPYRAAIIKGIRLKALELLKNGQMKTALKTFISRSIDHNGNERDKEDLKKEEVKESVSIQIDGKDAEDMPDIGEALDKAKIKHDIVDGYFHVAVKDREKAKLALKNIKHTMKQVNESEMIVESVATDFWEAFKKMIAHISPDSQTTNTLLGNNKLDMLINKSGPAITASVPSQLRMKLKALSAELDKADTSTTVSEGTNRDEMESILQSMLNMADSNKNKQLANGVMATTAFKQMMAKSKAGLPQKFSGSLRSRLNAVKAAIQAAENLSSKSAAPTAALESITITEDGQEWKFEKGDGDTVKISCASLGMSLDPEQLEKAIKGITNRDAVVVRDAEDASSRFVFSPRGVNVLVKKVGHPDGFMMDAKQVEQMLDFAGKIERDDTDGESEEEVDSTSGEPTKDAGEEKKDHQIAKEGRFTAFAADMLEGMNKANLDAMIRQYEERVTKFPQNISYAKNLERLKKEREELSKAPAAKK